MMKKVFCFILSIALVFAMSLPSYATTNSNLNVSSMDGSIDELDALLVASSFLNSEDAANDILCTNSSNNYVISLYDETGNVVAYYDGNTTDGKVETVYAILLRNPVCREID